MESSSSRRTGVDMNDPATLDLYNQLLIFKILDTMDSLELNGLSNQLQGTLHQLADRLGLQYEFSLSTRLARISRQNSDLSFVDNMSADFLVDLDKVSDQIIETNSTPPDANYTPTGTISNSELISQYDQKQQPESNIDDLFSTLFDGDLSSLLRYQTLNEDFSSAGLPGNSSPDTIPWTKDSDMWSGLDQEGAQQDSATDMLALDLDSQMEDVIDLEGQEGPKLPSEATPPSASLVLGASYTGEPNKKRKQTETTDMTAYFSPPSRTYSNATSSAPSINSSRGSSLSGSANNSQGKRYKSKSHEVFRRYSTHSGSSYESQERVMDWRSELSGSQISLGSSLRGKLSDAARAGRNAVKKAKACWRCKIQKKKCSPEDPCALCGKGQKLSPWVDVPCSRGSIQHQMFPIALCPTHQSLLNEPCQKSYSGIIIPVNIYLTETRHKRTEHLRHLGSFAYTFCKDRNIWPLNWPLSSYYERFPVECFRGSRFSSLKANLTASSVPINECILELIWELEKTTSSRAMVEECFGFENFVLLCTSAASYQARLVNDNLISQSLICLRSCLEALRAQKSGILEGQSHEYCHLGKCNIKCLHDIHTNIQRYLDEVSRVILESDMTQKRNPWWLSIFYSVCIQSLVRKTLLRLPSYRVEACQQYLHLPIRVFVAMSSTFDPLIRSPLPDSSSSEEVPNEGDLVSARSAVNRARWGQIGIRNSGDYLKQLLEDKGATLLRPEDGFDSTTCQKIFDKMATRNNRALGMGKFANYLTNSIIDDANQA